MDTCLSNTAGHPTIKEQNALIIMIRAFRAFLDQPQQFSHGSKTNAEATGRSE